MAQSLRNTTRSLVERPRRPLEQHERDGLTSRIATAAPPPSASAPRREQSSRKPLPALGDDVDAAERALFVVPSQAAPCRRRTAHERLGERSRPSRKFRRSVLHRPLRSAASDASRRPTPRRRRAGCARRRISSSRLLLDGVLADVPTAAAARAGGRCAPRSRRGLGGDFRLGRAAGCRLVELEVVAIPADPPRSARARSATSPRCPTARSRSSSKFRVRSARLAARSSSRSAVAIALQRRRTSPGRRRPPHSADAGTIVSA